MDQKSADRFLFVAVFGVIHFKMDQKRQKEGTMGAAARILLAGFGWGVIGVFSRPLSAAGLSAVQVTLVRSVIVAAGMALYLLFTDRRQFRIQLKDLWMFLGTGLLSIVFFNIDSLV